MHAASILCEEGGRKLMSFIYLFIYLFIHLFVYLFIYLFIYTREIISLKSTY